jgi:hypothetical protein
MGTKAPPNTGDVGEKNLGNGPQQDDVAAAALVLHPEDNVVVCRRDVHAGERLSLDGETMTVPSDVPLGHKIARRPIPFGAPVVKYGMAIGSATTDIQVGEWVHMHNLKSDYIASHTRDSREQR